MEGEVLIDLRSFMELRELFSLCQCSTWKQEKVCRIINQNDMIDVLIITEVSAVLLQQSDACCVIVA